MLNTFTLGKLRVSNIIEYFGPTHPPGFLYPEFDRTAIQRNSDWLVPNHYYPNLDRFVITIQTWVVQAEDRIIVIDTGVGNRKNRGAERMHQLNTLFLHWLAAAGAPREKVTHVLMTHLHSDHVGWNTMLVDGRWEPTFPNAKYLIPKRDFEFFMAERDAGRAIDAGSLADSVLPAIAAGLAEFVTDQRELADLVRVVPVPGHTPGQLNYWIESEGERGVFSGDVMHHPMQIVEPGWNSAFCVASADAKATRAQFLDQVANAGALVMPCHFGPPHCGYVRRQGSGHLFEPTIHTRLL